MSEEEVAESQIDCECRVCRGEEEVGRPLVAPCLCSGSILLCHQDCLEEWLKHSKKTSCELCGREYVFTPEYAADMPEHIPYTTVIVSSTNKLFTGVVPYVLRLGLVIFLWLIILPLMTTWIYLVWIHRKDDESTTKFMFSRASADPRSIEEDIVNGIILAGMIALSFLVIMSFTDFLRFDPGGNNVEEVHNPGVIPMDMGPMPMPVPVPVNPIQPMQNAGAAAPGAPVAAGRVLLAHDQDRNRRRVGAGDAEGLALNNQLLRPPVPRPIPNPNQIGVHEPAPLPGPHGQEEEDEEAETEAEEAAVANQNQRDQGENEREVAPQDGFFGFQLFGGDPDPELLDPDMNLNLNLDADLPGDEDGLGGQGLAEDPNIFDAFDDQLGEGEGEIRIALDELLGLRGPLTSLVRNVLWLLAFNGAYIGLFAFIPYSIGSSIYSMVKPYLEYAVGYITTSFASSDGLMTALTADFRVVMQVTTAVIQVNHMARISIGIVTLVISVLLMGEVVQRVHKFVPMSTLGYVSEVLQLSRSVLKVGTLLFVRILCLPILLGSLVMASTNIVMQYSRETWLSFILDNPVGVLAVAWVTGICFMLFVMLCILQLREVLHPRFLGRWVKPQEAHLDLLNSLLTEPIMLHIKRISLSLVVYMFLLIYFVVAPALATNYVSTWLGFAPDDLKLQFWYGNAKLQLPLELLMIHVAMLTVTEHNKDVIGIMQYRWLVFACRKLGLTRFLLPVTSLKRPSLSRGQGQDEGESSGQGNALNTGRDTPTEDVTAAATTPDLPETPPPRVGSSSSGLYESGEAYLAPLEFETDGFSEDILFNDEWQTQEEKRLARFGRAIERPPIGWETQKNAARWTYGPPTTPLEQSLAPRFVPSWWFARLSALILSSWVLSLMIIEGAVFIPIIIGRTIGTSLRLPVQYMHDLTSFYIGSKLLFIAFKFAHLVNIRMLKQSSLLLKRILNHLPFSSTFMILRKVIKWAVGLPLLIGIFSCSLFDVIHLWMPHLPHVPILGDIIAGNPNAISACASAVTENTCDNSNILPMSYFSHILETKFDVMCRQTISMFVRDWRFGIAFLILVSILSTPLEFLGLGNGLRIGVNVNLAPNEGQALAAQAANNPPGEQPEVEQAVRDHRDRVDDQVLAAAVAAAEEQPRPLNGNVVLLWAMIQKQILDAILEIQSEKDTQKLFDSVTTAVEDLERQVLAKLHIYLRFLNFSLIWHVTLPAICVLLKVLSVWEYSDGSDVLRRSSNIGTIIAVILYSTYMLEPIVSSWLSVVYSSIRDETYLIGKKLECSAEGKEKIRELGEILAAKSKREQQHVGSS